LAADLCLAERDDNAPLRAVAASFGVLVRTVDA
jgi:hypothetical protein